LHATAKSQRQRYQKASNEGDNGDFVEPLLQALFEMDMAGAMMLQYRYLREA
jgi:hypothetical protein